MPDNNRKQRTIVRLLKAGSGINLERASATTAQIAANIATNPTVRRRARLVLQDPAPRVEAESKPRRNKFQ